MPRNASGTYSLPEPPFVTQTTISSTVMNSQLSDIASALTQSIASTGVTPLTGGLKGIVSSSVVAYGYDGDTTTGWGSDTAGQTYFKSAGTEVVRITATGFAVTGTFSTTGGFANTITTTGSSASFIAFEGISTEAGAAVGPSFSSYRNSASPVALDVLGSFDFYGQDSTNVKTLYGRIVTQLIDPTDGTEDASMYLQIQVAGTLTSVLNISSTGVDIVGAFSAATSLTAATVAGSMIATQAQMEAASATNLIVTPGRLRFDPGVAKAWVYYTYVAGTPTILASHNVTSLSDNGTGEATINFTVPFSSANYVFVGSSMVGLLLGGGALIGPATNAPTASAFRVVATNAGAPSDNPFNFAAFYGDQ